MTSNSGHFPSFLESPLPPVNSGSLSRLAPSPIAAPPQAQGQANGNNGAAPVASLAGSQMDVNFLYHKVVELSEILKENRERTAGIVAGAEELASRAASNGAAPSLQEANAEVSVARIADLERRLAHEQNKVRVLTNEQQENVELIAKWEHEVGELLRRVREHTFDAKTQQVAIARQYNKLLQEEKDAHLAARLERDDWHARFMRAAGMLREAYRLRCEEENQPTRVISGLQNEVRAYRSALGMDPEKAESEYGWEYLKDMAPEPA